MAKKLSQIATEIATCTVKQTKALSNEEGRDAAFGDIKAQTDKVGSINGEEPDWPLVEKAAAGYLRKAECDFRVAVYLARAWSVNHGANGALAGMVLISKVLERDAEELLPTRIGGRRQAIEWWSKHTLLDWQNSLFAASDAEQLAEFIQKLEALDAMISANAGLVGKPELVKALIDGLGALQNGVADASENQEAVTQGEANTQQSDDVGTAGAESIESDGEFTGDESADDKSVSEEGADDSGVDEDNTDIEPDAEVALLIERLLSPVSNDNPTGDEQYLSDEFEHIQREVNAGWRVKTTDWDALLTDSDHFLRTMSKDLRVMVYTIYALLELRSLAGLSQGLHVLDEFITRYAATCYPARPAGRRAALSWLAKTASEWFRRRPDETFELESLLELRRLLDGLNVRLLEDEQLNVGQAVLGKALSSVRSQIERSEANLPVASAASTPAVAPKPRAAVASASKPVSAAPATSEMETEADFRSAVNSGKTYWLDLARFRRQKDPSSPLSYRLLRYWAWGSLGDQVKVDSLQPPANSERDAWETAASAGDGPKMIELTEAALLKHRFCLDLNRLTCEALELMGHMAASAAVKDELRQFLERIPGLSSAQFRGSVPTADGATLGWIEQLQQGGDPAVCESVGNTPGASSAATASGQEAMANARLFLKEGNSSAAVSELEQHLRLAQSGRERFYWQQLLARLFLESGAIELALVMLETLDAQIENYRLEEWDRELIIELAPLVQQVDVKVSKDSILRSRINVIVEKTRARITRVDPAGAIEKYNR